MSDAPQTQPAGWYYAQGDPPGTQRYWDGQKWEGGPQPVPGVSQEAVGGATTGLAEQINRIAGRFIDYIVWFVIWIILSSIFVGGINFTTDGDTASVDTGSAILAGLLATALATAYEALMVGSRGQTLGKMALGTKVTRVDGAPITIRDGFMRTLPGSALGVLLFLPFIGLLALIAVLVTVVASLVFLFTDAQRQTVWDKVAKTVVVSSR